MLIPWLVQEIDLTPDGHPKLPHLWPPKQLQARWSNVGGGMAFCWAHYSVKSKIRQASRLLERNDSYKIGDAAIDEHHPELFMRATNVIAATSLESQTLSALRLFQYTRTHFLHEENLMPRRGYPDLDRIKAELEDFISCWFLGHVATADSKLAAYLEFTLTP